jgi:3-methyl-2-oxobutanoate hydroxymethyltransferase
MRTSITDILEMKSAGHRITMITAYDFPSAMLAEKAEIKLLLVGDSLGMVVQGHDNTLQVRVDDMVRHAAYVTRGTTNALVVADLPFLSYATVDQGVQAARRLVQEGGVQAVKLEGGRGIIPVVRRLVELGVPVMGHLGYTPQSTHKIGLRVQAKDIAGGRTLLEDAIALEAAGAFAVVLELVPAPLAKAVTERLSIPTIGIGAGAGCDGQVQVWHDLLGLFEGKTFRHAKRYGEVGEMIVTALRSYVREVETGAFPTEAHSSTIPNDVLDAIMSGRPSNSTP